MVISRSDRPLNKQLITRICRPGEQRMGEEEEEVFKQGPLPIRTFTVAQAKPDAPSLGPLKPLLLVVPAKDGDYPVLLFLHGYLLYNSFYTQLLQHVASHGYIAIAPQMYDVIGPDATGEIADAATLADWLPRGLIRHFPEDVQSARPDFQRFAIAGHSRGGKVAFALALGRSLKFSAVAGLDPVDGMGRGLQTAPAVLRYRARSLDVGMPTLVVGSGLGSQSRLPLLFPPCAPEGVSHRDFFAECCAPAYHFVPLDYGHMDLLDDHTPGLRGKISRCLCKTGEAREPMRRFSAGILVAFLNASLRGDAEALNGVLAHPSRAPVRLEPPQSLLDSEASEEGILKHSEM